MTKESSRIFVRLVEAKDKKHTPVVCEMIVDAFKSIDSWTIDTILVTADRTSADEINALIDNNGKPDIFMYAFKDDQVVGSILIEESGMLSMFAVHLQHQSQGIGNLLVREALDYMKSNMATKEAIVQVVVCRPVLVNWYRRLGFEGDELIPFPVKSILLVDEAPMVILKKKL